MLNETINKNVNIKPNKSKSLYNPKIDTTKFKNRPKDMETMARPDDDAGAIQYDLKHIHGIGAKEAVKLQQKGVTLDNLVNELDIWILKNPNNGIFLPTKMPIPDGYSKTKWDTLDENKKLSVLKTDLNKRLTDDTKFLKELKYDSLVFVKHLFDVMNDRIPRTEIERAEKVLKIVSKAMNPDIIVMLCGSYRRGKLSSGDIDCLITHPLIKNDEDIKTNSINVLHQFVDVLINKGFIIDQLSMGQVKFMGLCKVPNKDENEKKSRRIDIRYIPYDSFGCSVLYFTGSANFNVKMRNHALSKGYSLNEYYLKKKEDNSVIPCSTEEDVFKILNYPYKTPKERDI
jgi:DNA polymerase/3'-5' exonuclease PolX